MSSNDPVSALLEKIIVAGDGAVISILLAVAAVKTWQMYTFTSNALHKINEAPIFRIYDLRQFLENQEPNSDSIDDGKLVVVRGILEAKSSMDRWRIFKPNTLVSHESGQSVVVLQNTQTCLSNQSSGLFGWTSESWMDHKSISVKMVPFVLRDQTSTSDYLFVNMDDSKHPLPLSTVYHKIQPIQASSYTYLQAFFGHAYPVGLLDEEKVLSVGKQISAVGVCSFKDGVPQIKSSQALPCFLTEMTKDQLVVDLAFKTKCFFWGGLILGALSIGVLGYATMRSWERWKEWRQERQNGPFEEADSAEDTELQADEIAELPEGELCLVCLTRRRRSAFVPCGHMVCCRRCALTVRRDSSPICPVCERTVRRSIVIYSS